MMKILKRAAVLALCMLAMTGCTQSSITTQSNMVTDPTVTVQETAPTEREALVEEDAAPETRFDWEQTESEVADLFGDTDFYPESVKMEYDADEEALTIDLKWVLANGTTEDVAMDYAVEMVQMFNDILAAQVTDVEFSAADSFGGLWDEYALNVKVGTEDGKWLIDKSYKAGEQIDLVLPEASGNGPAAEVKETERISPSKS